MNKSTTTLTLTLTAAALCMYSAAEIFFHLPAASLTAWNSLPDPVRNPNERHSQGRTEPSGCLAFAWWAGWAAGQVGRHVKCWSRS